MIRWSYLVPRLLVVGALLIFLGQGVDPLARWAIVTGGQALTGAKVEVEAISTSLGHAQMAAKNVAIANPRAPDTNLVSAEYLWADLDGKALARNRIVVDKAIINGLKLNAARADSGAVDKTDVDDADSGGMDTQWLEDAAKALGQDFADDLESVQKARELKQRWPEEYRTLEARIDTWIDQVKALEQLPDQLKREYRGNYIAQAEEVRKAALTVKALKEELASIRGEFQRLHQQTRIDRTDLADAAARDIEKTKQKMQLAKLDPVALTDHFLGPELGPQTRETLAWVQWVREQIPSSDIPQPQRGRGVDIAFAEPHPAPWLLVRSLAIDGEMHWRGKVVPFAALASDWTVQPKVHGQPATIKIKTNVPAESWIHLTVDRTCCCGERKDQLSYICPALPVSAKTLGDDKYMAVVVPEGTIDVRANFSMVNEQIAGTIELVRHDASPTLLVGSKLNSSSLAERLQQKSQSLDKLNVVVTIGGTLDDPETKIESPLGEQIRLVLQDSLREEFDARSAEVAAKVRTEIDQEIQSLQDEIALQKAKVMKKLNLAGEQEKMIEELIANALGTPKGQLGRKLFQALERR